jgi:hypothetical protein
MTSGFGSSNSGLGTPASSGDPLLFTCLQEDVAAVSRKQAEAKLEDGIGGVGVGLAAEATMEAVARRNRRQPR